MSPKDTSALGRQGGYAEVGRTPDAVHPAAELLVGLRTKSPPLGRFLLSSTSFHLILAWAAISLGLPQAPSAPRPLVVTLIGSEHAEPSAPSGRLDRTRTRQPSAPRQAAPPANVTAMAQPRVSPQSPAFVAPVPARMAGATESTALDERIGKPKTVGISAGESHVVGADAPGVFATGGRSLGPVLLGPDGDGEVGGSGAASRGGTGRLDAALVAPLAPSVTLGFPKGEAGGGTGGWAGNGAVAGRFLAPNYGINPLPKYPLLAREKGYEGIVYLRVLVRVDGRVGRLAVDRSSGHEILDRAAMDSVKEWAFFPAKKGGNPVESWVLLPVKFALN